LILSWQEVLDKVWRTVVAPLSRGLGLIGLLSGVMVTLLEIGGVAVPRLLVFVVMYAGMLGCGLMLLEVKRLRAGGID